MAYMLKTLLVFFGKMSIYTCFRIIIIIIIIIIITVII